MGVEDRNSAAAGRPALALSRDTDFEDVVRAVNSLPAMAETQGIDTAIAWAQTELRSLLGLLDLGEARTPARAKDAHRVIGIGLTEGIVRVMARDDRAGFLCRRDFLSAVEYHLLGPTLKAVFNRTAPDVRNPYLPITGER